MPQYLALSHIHEIGLGFAGRGVSGITIRRACGHINIWRGCGERGVTAKQFGMSRNVLRIWVGRYTATGIAGLVDRHGGGAPARLTAAQRAALKDRVLAGADLERDAIGPAPCSDAPPRRPRNAATLSRSDTASATIDPLPNQDAADKRLTDYLRRLDEGDAAEGGTGASTMSTASSASPHSSTISAEPSISSASER
jgi:Winged helix-turn helix